MVESKWEIVRTDTFKQLYAAKDEFLKRKTKEVIDQLAQEANPLRLGEKKKPLDFWATDLTRSDRLAYFVLGNKLVLLKVCSHKEVYGRD